MQSIMQVNKECFVCHKEYDLESHHIIYGTANRKLSEEFGLKVWLCKYHHTSSQGGVHFNSEMDKHLKKLAQERFEEVYPDLNFRRIFGKNYK